MCPHCSTDGVCPCTCDYVVDASCTCRDLAGAINVTLSKSAVYASYPLQYVQTFNYKPYEVRRRTTSGTLCLSIFNWQNLHTRKHHQWAI